MTTTPQGWVLPGDTAPEAGQASLLAALERLDRGFAVALTSQGPAVVRGGQAILADGAPPAGALPLLAWVPALTPDRLGDPSFGHTYGTRIPYVVGAMANGVASVETVVAAARAGGIGFFGSAGLSTRRVEEAISRLQSEAAGLPWTPGRGVPEP